MLRDDFPHEYEIDPKVLVDDHIPEPDDLRPGDLRVSFSQLRGYAPAGLAKQRQTVEYRTLND